jgi:hypothetical protein
MGDGVSVGGTYGHGPGSASVQRIHIRLLAYGEFTRVDGVRRLRRSSWGEEHIASGTINGPCKVEHGVLVLSEGF